MAYETIEVKKKKTYLIVRVVRKRVFLDIAEKFKIELIPLIEKHNKNVIINLEKVEIMNSSGLGVLILARDILSAKDCKVTICGVKTVMHEIFWRMRLDLLFKICESEEEAFKNI